MRQESISLRSTLARGVERRLAARGTKRWTVALDAGVSPRTLQAVLRGSVGIRVSTLADLARALGCLPRHLLDELDVGPPHTRVAIDLPRVVAYNIELRWRERFANVSALAAAADISTSQLYVILDAGCRTSIDQLAVLGHALAIPARELVSAPEVVRRIPEFCTPKPVE